ncbi:hypothetical protein G6F59_015094 [Rhizopus arrhizus]|nr:hypothetical protein G6F59_015094 [Rhizopus arrhizus]
MRDMVRIDHDSSSRRTAGTSSRAFKNGATASTSTHHPNLFKLYIKCQDRLAPGYCAMRPNTTAAQSKKVTRHKSRCRNSRQRSWPFPSQRPCFGARVPIETGQIRIPTEIVSIRPAAPERDWLNRQCRRAPGPAGHIPTGAAPPGNTDPASQAACAARRWMPDRTASRCPAQASPGPGRSGRRPYRRRPGRAKRAAR